MAASKGQNRIGFLRSMETALSSATKRELAVVKNSKSQTAKVQYNEKHLRNAMLTAVCSYLEWLLPPPHFHQRGFREGELTVWRAVRNALVHHGGDLTKTTRPSDAELLARRFLLDCQSGTEVDSDGQTPVAPYFTIDSAGIVTLEAQVYFRARKLAFDLLVHVGMIVP